MKKVAIYVRVSTQDQAEEGYSVDEQIDKLKMYCQIKDWHIHNTYVDPGFSGSNVQRPALQKLIRDVKTTVVDTVLVYKLDRLSRSQKDTLYLIEDIFIKHNVDFVSLNENFDTSTAFGKAMIGILSVFAQLEREQITERMQMGKVGRAKSGKAMSWVRPPFGYTYQDDQYVIDELQASIVKNIFTDYLNGISITKLRDKLNEEGHIGKDIKWSYRTLRQTLDNPVYAGLVKFKDKIYPGNHEPIISKSMYDQTQVELDIRQKKAYEQNNNPRPFQGKYMLSGILRCGYCGAPFEVLLGNIRKDGTRLKKYHCINRYTKRVRPTIYNNGKKCDSGYYQLADLEEKVLSEIEKLQINPQSILNLSKEDDSENNLELYQKRINALEKQMDKLTDLYMNDLITLESMQIKAKKYQEERESLVVKMKKDEILEKQSKRNEAIAILENTSIPIKKMSYTEQKLMVNRLVEKVDVIEDKIQIHWKF